MNAAEGSMRLRDELLLLLRRGGEVWSLVPVQHRAALMAAGAVMALTSIGNTAVALLLGQLVDRIQTGVDHQSSTTALYWSAGMILGGLAAIYVARELLHVLRRSLVERSCTLINRDMQLRLMGHALRLDLNSLTSEKVGGLHSRIFRCVDGLVRFVRLMFLDCLPAIFTGLFALFAATTKQPLLGLVMLGVAPIAIMLTVWQLRTQKGVRLQLMRDCEEIDAAVIEQLSSAEYIRVAHTYDQEMLRLFRTAEGRRNRELRHHFEMSLYGCAKALNEGFFHILVLGLATYLAINQRLSYGDILTFSVLYLNVMTPLNEVHRVLDEGHEASLRVGDLMNLLAVPEDRSLDIESSPRLLLRPHAPVIEIENVSASYVNSSTKLRPALRELSLVIQHGETIGVAGKSGSGKSTWIKVLLRLLHTEQGQIRVNGQSLNQISRGELARLVGYVGQNPFVFSGTIAENIAYGNGDVTRAQIEEAAQWANLHDEIQQMPKGYDSDVAERGHNLSGGQRQRLAIARILLKRAPILILDEATSALDNISERHVQRSLGITNSDRTTIMIAHRLTTLKDCDRIFVFEDGRIIETGGYQDLVEGRGVFAELANSANP